MSNVTPYAIAGGCVGALIGLIGMTLRNRMRPAQNLLSTGSQPVAPALTPPQKTKLVIVALAFPILCLAGGMYSLNVYSQYMAQGIAAYHRGNYPAAEQDFRHKTDSSFAQGDADGHYWLGLCFLAEKRYPEARAELQKACDLEAYQGSSREWTNRAKVALAKIPQ